MANYNKYINTFSGATDVAEWGAYIVSEYAGFPNVAYLETSDMVKYRFSGDTFNAPVGSIYYSDGTTTGPNDAVDTTKTPIGIVVIPALNDYSAQLGYNTIIMSLLAIDSAGTGSNGAVYCKWSTETVDTPLPNISAGNDLTNSENFDGKYNTSVLLASGNTYQAAYGCSLYSTEGTSAGDWYLPTSAEAVLAMTLLGRSGINNQMSKLNSASIATRQVGPYDYILTSTENSTANDIVYYVNWATTQTNGKTAGCTVYPFYRIS